MRRRVSFFHRSGVHLKEKRSVVSSPSPGNRGQSWSFRQRLLHAATACERPMGIQIVVHGSGMPWLEGLVRRLADSGVAAESSVPGLDSIEVNGSSRWNESRGLSRSMPSRLAAFVRRTWRDTRVPFWSRRVAACLWMVICSPHPNLLTGDAEGLQPLAEQLSGSGLLEGIHLAVPAGSSCTTVRAQPDWLRGVFQRIKARALSRRTDKEAKPEVGG